MPVTHDDPCNNPTTYRQNVSTVSLSAPASSSGDTSFATLDGLASGLNTGFRHTLYFGRVPNAAVINANPTIQDAQEKCVATNPDEEQNCTEFAALYSDRYLSAAQQDAVADAVFDEIVAGSYGKTFSGSVGYDEFDFFPDAAFEEDTVECISLSTGVGFIYFPSRGNSFLLEGNFQRTFDGADDATRCQTTPNTGNDFLSCVTGAFAGPTREENLILRTQYRQSISLSEGGLLPNIAIAPRAEFDALSNNYSFDLPIFLVGSKDGKMVVGLRLGYQDEDNDGEFKIGAFYGTAFDLTPL